MLKIFFCTILIDFTFSSPDCGWLDFNCHTDKVDDFFGLLFSDFPRNGRNQIKSSRMEPGDSCKTLTCKVSAAIRSGYKKIENYEPENSEKVNFARSLNQPVGESIVIREKQECQLFSFCGMVKAYDSFKETLIYAPGNEISVKKPENIESAQKLRSSSRKTINTADLFNQMAIQKSDQNNFLEQSTNFIRNGVVTGRALASSIGDASERVAGSSSKVLGSVVTLGKSKVRNAWENLKGVGDNMFFDAISVYNVNEEAEDVEVDNSIEFGSNFTGFKMTAKEDFMWLTTQATDSNDEVTKQFDDFSPRPRMKSVKIEEFTEKPYQLLEVPYEGSTDMLFTDAPYTDFPFNNFLYGETTAISLDKIRLYK